MRGTFGGTSGIFWRRELRDDVDLLIAQPVGTGGLHTLHVPHASADLALLERQRGLTRAGIAGDDPQLFEAEDILHRERQQIRVAGGRRRADGEALLADVVERLLTRRGQATRTDAELTMLPIIVMSGPLNCAFEREPENSGSKISAE